MPSESVSQQDSPACATPKRPRMEEWPWADNDTAEKVRKIPFSGSAGLKRRISTTLGDNSSPLETLTALLEDDVWKLVNDYTNAFARKKQRTEPDAARFPTTPGKNKIYIALFHKHLLVREGHEQHPVLWVSDAEKALLDALEVCSFL